MTNFLDLAEESQLDWKLISPGEIYDFCYDPGVDYLHTNILIFAQDA